MVALKQAGKKKSQPGRLRIVAGNWRSRLLEIAEVQGLRPTSERIRETLFNWLSPNIRGSRCLDLCAGTGALGLEALSRGAGRVVFAEKSAVAIRTLNKNIAALEADGAEVLNVDARDYLSGSGPQKFDIVFLDPPFAAELHGELCRLLNDGDWLADEAKVYIEMDKAHSDDFVPDNWRILKNKTAGKVRYMLATKEVDGSLDT